MDSLSQYHALQKEAGKCSDDVEAYASIGRRLLLVTTVTGNNPPLRLVLCELVGGGSTYATWMENLADSERIGHPATFHGNYFSGDELKLALEDMFRRAALADAKVYVP